MAEFIHIPDIQSVHNFIGTSSPHPLITVIRKWPNTDRDLNQLKFTSDLYYITSKRDAIGSIHYGRSSYDYQQGTMVFMKPGQVATFSTPNESNNESEGWTILFHPDLIRKSELGEKIKTFSFFSYETNEALHISEKEKQSLRVLVNHIEQEINQNIDKHSQDIIIQNLHAILNYSNRYYERQFLIRTNQNKDVVAKFENFLDNYFNSEKLENQGIPTLKYCGETMHMSGAYLSDLLRTETGKSAKDHIYHHLISKAKTVLLNSNQSINEIAYSLGFEYPQNFSKLFKSKTGISPTTFRNLN